MFVQPRSRTLLNLNFAFVGATLRIVVIKRPNWNFFKNAKNRKTIKKYLI